MSGKPHLVPPVRFLYVVEKAVIGQTSPCASERIFFFEKKLGDCAKPNLKTPRP